jgi:hypothetical protein
MYPELPIHQLLKRKDTRFQLGFANEARELVPARDEFVLVASPQGLRVLGRNEQALDRPVGFLREVYGSKLQVQPPEVRFMEGVQVKQPIMQVRISMERRFLAAVKRAMLERGASPEQEYVRSRYCVLRYQAPQAHLLGLPGELSLLGGGKVKHSMALSHYALVTGDPGGHAA